MPFCPECLAEYREGFTHCSSCGVDLVDKLPEPINLSEEAIKEALEGKELVPVSRGWLEAIRETRQVLTDERIMALVVDDPTWDPIPGVPNRVMLVVSKEDQEAAAKLLGKSFKDMIDQEGLDRETAPVDTSQCPACGASVPDSAEECPECGLFVGKA
ncbi:MAG: hypothetical protein JXR96_31195 [Deltaproteobacteria bacterium]|nr:hypothetical protein [Deltaproteobacteria bacterium]